MPPPSPSVFAFFFDFSSLLLDLDTFRYPESLILCERARTTSMLTGRSSELLFVLALERRDDDDLSRLFLLFSPLRLLLRFSLPLLFPCLDRIISRKSEILPDDEGIVLSVLAKKFFQNKFF